VRSTQDRRRVGVYLTPAGRELVARAPGPVHEGFLTRFRALCDWEQSLLLSSLERVADMMESSAPAEPAPAAAPPPRDSE